MSAESEQVVGIYWHVESTQHKVYTHVKNVYMLGILYLYGFDDERMMMMMTMTGEAFTIKSCQRVNNKNRRRIGLDADKTGLMMTKRSTMENGLQC